MFFAPISSYDDDDEDDNEDIFVSARQYDDEKWLQHGNTALHEAAWKGFSLTLSFLCQVRMLNCKYLI